MNKLKRILALTLVLCMLCSFLPAGAFAAGNDAPAITGTSDAPFEKGTGGSKSFRIPAIVTLSDGTLVAAADARWNTTYDGGGLDTMVAISSDGGESWTHSFANYLGDNGNEYNGSSSTCFIDPSLAVYTTDVNNDGIGEDTIFMLCDLYPYGVALNGNGNTAPSTTVGFNNAGKLLLSGDNHASYGYYLDGTVIRDADGNEVSGLTVDAHFNVSGSYNGNEVNSNLFFSDSPFKVVRTGFLYLTKSIDGGVSWSAPELLNLKTDAEQVCLVGPNGGMVTSGDVIVFPVYSYSNGTEHTGLIYSDDGGQTWERSASLTMHSSEADAVELDNGELRVFFRNKTGKMYYADYDLTTNSWGTPVDTDVKTNSNTELSAITYSLGVEDNGVEKTVILVSCPASANLEGSGDSNGSWRTSGRIFAGLVDPETYEMTWLANSFPLTPVATSQLSGSNYTAGQGFFAYSAMTQKYESGDLAVLYENNQFGWGSGDDKYYTIAYKTVTEEALAEALGVTFGGSPEIDVPGTEDGDDTLTNESLTVILGSPATATIDGVCLENGSNEDEFARIEWVGTEEEPFSAATLPTTSGSIEAYISDGKGNYLTLDGSSLVNVKDIAKATKWSISYQDKSSGYNRYRVKSGDYFVALVNGQLVASTTSSNINHFYTADKGFFGSSSNGGSNVWQYNGTSWIVGNSGDSNGKAYTYTPTHTTVTVTGRKLGWTSFLVGNTQYDITVNSTASKIVDVELKLGQPQTFTNKADNYANAEGNVEPDDTIAGMKLNGLEGVYTAGGFAKPADLTSAGSGYYIIKNSRAATNGAAGTLVSNTPNSTNNDGLKLEGTENAFGKSAVWYITASGDNSFTIQDTNDQYMTIGNSTASVGKTETALTYSYNDGSWKYAISKDGYYLNQFGGGTNTRAAGWNGNNAATDEGSQFEIYRFTGTLPSTEITFEGILPGKTIAVVGDTQYNITVEPANTVDVSLKLGQTKVITDSTGNYEDKFTEPTPAGIADMTVTGTDAVVNNTTLELVTEENFDAAKEYVIECVRSAKSGHAAYYPERSVLTSDGYGSGLDTNGPRDANTSQRFTIEGSDGKYYIGRNNQVVKIGNVSAAMADKANAEKLTLAYVDGQGWLIYVDNDGNGPDNGDYFLSDYSGRSWQEVVGYDQRNDDGNYWNIYEVVVDSTPAKTEITFEGLLPGEASAIVGNTQYNITVEPEHEVDVELDIGESKVYTDNTGNYADVIRLNPDANIAEMTVTGSNGDPVYTVSADKATALEANTTYIIRYLNSDQALTSNQGGTTWGDSDGSPRKFETYTGPEADNMWTLEPSGDGYKIKCAEGYLNLGKNAAWITADGGDVFTLTYSNGGWEISDGTYSIDALGGVDSYHCAGGWPDSGTRFDLYKVTETYPNASTSITFTSVSEGKTTAIVGTTLYNITVAPEHDVVDIELEVGETYTYTDTTGNYSRRVGQYPNRQYVSMVVDGETVYARELVSVDTLVSGKQYLIVNNYSHEALTATHTAIYGQWGNRDALITAPDVKPDSKHFWTFTETTGGYHVTTGARYLTVAGFVAYAGTTYQNPLTLTHTENGWTIFDAKTGPDLGHEGNGYYLADNMDQNNYTGGAQGNAALLSDGRSHWTIYEVVVTDELDHATTTVTFEGLMAGGRTSAIVGETYYNITVVEKEVDDEVQRIGTKVWDVDPEIQQANYEAWANMLLDEYTDESWDVYHDARIAALEKLYKVSQATYASEAEAEAALKELQDLMKAFEDAKNALVPAKTITINYQLDANTILTRNYKIAHNATTMALDETIVVEVDDTRMAYTVNEGEHHGGEASYANGILTLPEVDNQVNVSVSLMGALGNGFVGSENITGQHGGTLTCTLVDKPITAMTVTQGIEYTLLLKDALTDGQTVEWSTADPNVATVDQNGTVTSVDPGETNILAKIYENGELVQVNSIPITVMQNNYESGELTRKVALYTEQIDNTTIWCVFNGDTSKAFEVIEGELIYGYFEKASSSTDRDNNKTTAFSFFGDPDEAHALVYMNAVKTEGDFYLLHENGEIRDGNEYFYDTKNNDSSDTRGAGLWQALGLMTPANPDKNGGGVNDADWTIVKAMVEWAIAQHCDGGQGFTRRAEEGDIATNLTFVSDPMPTIEKAVDGVLPTTRKFANYRRFSETTDHYAAVNEQIYFTINVTLKAPTQWREYNSNRDQYSVTENGIQYAADADGNKFSAITYSNSTLVDEFLDNGFLYTKELDNMDGLWDGEIPEAFRTQQQDITDALNAAWTPAELEAGERVLPFYLIYTVQESDMSRSIIENIADLYFDYQSYYSRGAQKGAADAEASIRIVGYAIDDVVIDFGQPVVYEGHDYYVNGVKDYTFEGLTSAHLSGAYCGDETKATAKYGTVRVDLVDGKYTIKYTPTSILRETDTILIYGPGVNEDTDKLVNAFTIYPASTVYYEESFLKTYTTITTTNNTPGWSVVGGTQAPVNQTFELLGKSEYSADGKLLGKLTNKKYPYGYDPIYDGYVDEAEGNLEVTPSSIVSAKAGDAAEFTFTGTGFELFANCTESSGYISVEILNDKDQPVKMLMVNTVVKAGTSGATSGQSGAMDALPVVSVKDLEHGAYTVRITKIMADNKSVSIDGVRIFNTLADSAVYTIDLEDNPEFYQLRDAVLNAINIQDYLGESMYQEDLEEGAGQVFAGISSDSEAPSAIITSVGEIYTSEDNTATPQDLLDNGPKNELYLWPEQTLTFKVATNRVIQVGMKAPCADTGYMASVLQSNSVTPAVLAGDISGQTDMFYSLTASSNANADNYYLVAISNIGDDILAITDLKICDDPSAALAPLTQDDIYQILISSGYTDESETPDVPVHFEDVPEDAYYHDAVAWAVEKKITSGISATMFGPDVNCTRAQAVTFLWSAAGKPTPTATVLPFVDVAQDSYYYNAVLWAVEHGITSGTDATHFSPDASCTRAQIVTFLYHAFDDPASGSAENPFSDVPADTWYTAPITWAVAEGITSGVGNGQFGVDNICTRAQIVTFLYKAYN